MSNFDQYSPLRILSDGLDQAQRLLAPDDVVANLKAALSELCPQTNTLTKPNTLICVQEAVTGGDGRIN